MPILVVWRLALGLASAAVDVALPAQQAAAHDQFSAFVQAYRTSDYRSQWSMVDPRMRHWFPIDRWRAAMVAGRRRHGELVRTEIVAVEAVSAEQLPCTEMGHCFRRGVPYVLLVLKTVYAGKKVPQPEFAVMARSDEGWRFAGGTFPATSLGETAVLLDEVDEAKYRAFQRVRRP